MKILLVNKFYYPRGGDCLVMMGTEKLLLEQGHEVAVFSMQYPQNLTSPWEKYFPEEVSFSKGKVAAVKRLLGKDSVVQKFTKLVDDFEPNVVHLHNVHSYLSPVVAKIAKDKGAKVVWTLHDYKLICSSYSFLREGKVCELCLTNPSSVLTKRCMKKNIPASLLAYIEANVWNRKRLEKYTDAFICPSQFMAQKMVEAGFSESKLHVVSNFFSFEQTLPPNNDKQRENSYCYVGRLSEEKGIDLLLQVASKLSYKLYVAGAGEMLSILKAKYNQENIVFLGLQSREQVASLLQRVSFSVVPSICYENNPLSVIESLCLGTPVLGANIGGIPELIESARNGFIFNAGDASDLKRKIKLMFDQIENRAALSSEDIQYDAVSRFSVDSYYEKLLNIYSE